MSKEKWQRKVDALVRLAEDHRGKPRGYLARRRLREILAEQPEMVSYEPFVELVRKDLCERGLRPMPCGLEVHSGPSAAPTSEVVSDE